MLELLRTCTVRDSGITDNERGVVHTLELKRIVSLRLVILLDTFRAYRTDPKFGSLASGFLKCLQKNIIIFIGNKVSSLFKWQKISNATFLLTQQTSARTQTVCSLPHSVASESSTCCTAAFSGREF